MTHSLFTIESAKFHKDMGYDRASTSFFIASVALSPTRIFCCLLDLEDKGELDFDLPFTCAVSVVVGFPVYFFDMEIGNGLQMKDLNKKYDRMNWYVLHFIFTHVLFYIKHKVFLKPFWMRAHFANLFLLYRKKISSHDGPTKEIILSLCYIQLGIPTTYSLQPTAYGNLYSRIIASLSTKREISKTIQIPKIAVSSVPLTHA